MKTAVFSFQFSVFSLILLSGCAGDHAGRQNNQFPPLAIATPSSTTRTIAVGDIVKPSEPKEIATVDQLEKVSDSNNAMQQSLSAGIGAEVGKVAENVDASLARIDANVSAKMDAALNATAELKASLNLESKIDAAVQASATATANLEARLNAKLDARFEALAQAQAQGLVGIGNTLKSSQESIRAGGNVNQFSDAVKDVVINAQNETSWNIRIMCGVLASVLCGTHVHSWFNHRKQMQALQAQGNTNVKKV